MKNKYQVSLIIPALNEAESIATVLASIPMEYVHEVLIVDGGSTDNTVQISLNTGAKVIHESRRGYGFACHAGLMKAEGEIDYLSAAC